MRRCKVGLSLRDRFLIATVVSALGAVWFLRGASLWILDEIISLYTFNADRPFDPIPGLEAFLDTIAPYAVAMLFVLTALFMFLAVVTRNPDRGAVR